MAVALHCKLNFVLNKIGFGGSCHWCTEAIFLSIKGVQEVSQGWIAPDNDPELFSEAVIVAFDKDAISLADLVTVHLHSHSCTSDHHLRSKYRSAIYLMDADQETDVRRAIAENQKNFKEKIITDVIPFGAFKINSDNYLNYYFKDPQKPFCENIVNPKLMEIIRNFNHLVNREKLSHLLNDMIIDH